MDWVQNDLQYGPDTDRGLHFENCCFRWMKRPAGLGTDWRLRLTGQSLRLKVFTAASSSMTDKQQVMNSLECLRTDRDWSLLPTTLLGFTHIKQTLNEREFASNPHWNRLQLNHITVEDLVRWWQLCEKSPEKGLPRVHKCKSLEASEAFLTLSSKQITAVPLSHEICMRTPKTKDIFKNTVLK